MDSVFKSWTHEEMLPEWYERYEVTHTGDSASYSGRDLFRVVCKDCGLELHWNTTYPNEYIERHERDAHK